MDVIAHESRYPRRIAVRPVFLLNAVLLLALAGVSACDNTSEQDRMEAIRQEAQRIEAIRQEAQRMAAEQARLEREAQVQRERRAREYARKAGKQIMDAIGGGQDLIVSHQLRYHDPDTSILEIAMDVSFNGALFRSNNYQVTGVLTVGEDGTSPRFARRDANQNYKDAEATMTALGVTVAGVLVLNEMGKESASNSQQKQDYQQKPATTWQINELEICNGAGAEPIYAAYTYNDGKTSYAKGWYQLNDNECKKLGALNEHKKVRLFAMSNSRTWSGMASYCVNMRDAFTIRQSGTACTSGQTAKDFFSMTLNEPGNGRMKVVFDANLDRELERLLAEANKK